ncbi:C-C motif chemokine 20-like [Hoplias malabaricus]|uniref:C-C motif chemokine 20-like n=1 Tax=Hoplias malabaricus TaxID=27720 RepID=UPI003461FB0A
MTQISGSALTLLLVLTVSLCCQNATAFACCRKYTKGEIPFGIIRGYSIQTMRGVCNIDAIVFHTSIGRNVCADPAQSWVMESIRKLKEKVKALKKKNKTTQ